MAQLVPLHLLDPSPDNPRHGMQRRSLRELADSFRSLGILEPLIVEPNGGRYLVVAGHRRLAAARIAGLHEVPVEVREPRPTYERLAAMIVENVQRKDLTGREKAEAYQRLIEEHGMTQREVAEIVGLHPSTISNTLQLLRPAEEREQARLERYRRRDNGHAPVAGRPVEATPQDCLLRLRESVRDGSQARLTPTHSRILLAMLQTAAAAVREARERETAIADRTRPDDVASAVA